VSAAEYSEFYVYRCRCGDEQLMALGKDGVFVGTPRRPSKEESVEATLSGRVILTKLCIECLGTHSHLYPQ
jgi:hypothetical protein